MNLLQQDMPQRRRTDESRLRESAPDRRAPNRSSLPVQWSGRSVHTRGSHARAEAHRLCAWATDCRRWLQGTAEAASERTGDANGSMNSISQIGMSVKAENGFRTLCPPENMLREPYEARRQAKEARMSQNRVQTGSGHCSLPKPPCVHSRCCRMHAAWRTPDRSAFANALTSEYERRLYIGLPNACRSRLSPPSLSEEPTRKSPSAQQALTHP